MKVISFKVNDNVYFALRKKLAGNSFRSVFEPIAIEIAQNNTKGLKYTPGIPTNIDDLYIDLANIQKLVEKLLTNSERRSNAD